MNGGSKDKGYTLVEVMIFLAVTGALFVMAMVAINGKQAQAEFATGVRDFNSRIQSIINEVNNGYFPENASYNCKFAGGLPGAALDLSTGGSPSGQGTHPDCVFLGKVVYFDFTVLPASQVDDFHIITVAGGAYNDKRQPITTYSASRPAPVAGPASSVDLSETAKVTNGLIVSQLISKAGAAVDPNISAFAIFTSLPQYNINTTSGSLSANTVSIPNSDRTDSLAITYSNILSIATSTPTVNDTIAICLQHGVGGKKAAIIVGTQSRQLYAEVHIADADSAVQNNVTGIGGTTCP